MRRRVAACLVFVAACANSSPRPDVVTATTASAVATATVPSSATVASAPPSLSAPPIDSAAASAPADAGAPDASAPIVADNQVKPIADPTDAETRARALLDAVMKDDPSLGESMWFPRDPFLVLKDIKDPAKYWAELHRAYAKDIHELHKKRASWDGCAFSKLEPGSAPKWVKPGEEANKIGYYRSFRWMLHVTTPDGDQTFELHTVITWQGRWYVTHLRKFK